MIFRSLRAFLTMVLAGTLVVAPVRAAESAQDLALKLSNPIANLISVPFQLNYEKDIGVLDTGHRWTLNLQPVVPVELNPQWIVISRTIVPLITQGSILPGLGTQAGLGDSVQSLFFSPKQTPPGGLVWGAGPVFLVPTGTDDLLSARKWGIGPTGVALKQIGPWTIGALGNHIFSFAGDGSRPDISTTFLQPFLSYTTPKAWTYSLNSETTYDWKRSELTLPLNLNVAKVFRINTQLVSLGGSVRQFVESPASGSEDLSVRLTLTLLFPK